MLNKILKIIKAEYETLKVKNTKYWKNINIVFINCNRM